ncbi:DinB family protein [Salibacteraceae bacterium]|jgi:hypothetical protein|nr:DinB family protein [Salibacteraceae bacterium]
MEKPSSENYPKYFANYIALVEGSDILKQWEVEASQTVKLIRALSDEQWNHGYDKGKWTVRQVILHMMDVECVFAYRALCIARGQTENLPSFDHDSFAESSLKDLRTREEIAEDYFLMRIHHLRLFGSFAKADLERIGKVSGNPMMVRAIPFIQLGHERHHKLVLKEKYNLVD